MKAIIFDCFGVLTTDLWKEFLASLPADMDIEPARALNRAYDEGHIGMQEFLEGVRGVTGQTPSRVEELEEGTIDFIKNTSLLDFIGELRAQQYKIGMISNIATNWVRDSFLSAKEQQLFDAMIFSFEVGIAKPDTRIFELACERLGVEPAEAVFIDDIDRFCAAAKDLGMQAIVYKDLQQMKHELATILKTP